MKPTIPKAMSEASSLGLSELIEQVKRDLLAEELDPSGPPLFSVDEIDLHLQVTVEKSGNAGVSIKVLQVGGQVAHHHAQTIHVKLTPLLSKEERIAVIKRKYPELWEKVETVNTTALSRGNL